MFDESEELESSRNQDVEVHTKSVLARIASVRSWESENLTPSPAEEI